MTKKNNLAEIEGGATIASGTLSYMEANFPIGPANSRTFTKSNYVDILYECLGISRAEGGMIIDDVFSEIQTALLEGRDVKLANFGTFTTRDKVARPGRNPKTGQDHLISARRVVTFVPAPHLRDCVAGFVSPEDPEELDKQ